MTFKKSLAFLISFLYNKFGYEGSEKMRTIYVVLTKTGTYLSKFIHLITRADYTHASMSFEEGLQPLYSFSRFYTYLPLPAGLHNEPLDLGFFKKHSRIPCAVYKIEVDEDTYASAKEEVERMLINAKYYRFSILGLMFCGLRIPLTRKRYYFCSQFVSHILTHSEALQLPYEPSLMRPNDYSKIENIECVFKGRLDELKETLNTYNKITA